MLRCIAAVACLLPYALALALAWGLAALAFHVFRYRRTAALERIRSTLGVPHAQAKRIAWISMRNTCFTAVEIIRIGRLSPHFIAHHWKLDSLVERLSAHYKTTHPCIVAVPHMGNWEMAAAVTRRSGFPVFSFAAQQKNPLVDAYLNARRRAPGVPTIARGSGTLRAALKRLRNGEAMAMLPDLRHPQPGIPTPFLNSMANIAPGMATLARRTGAPIFPAVVRRHGWFHHSITMYDPIRPEPDVDETQDVTRMTHAVLKIFDSAIQAEPEQWFWFNKRWILDPL